MIAAGACKRRSHAWRTASPSSSATTSLSLAADALLTKYLAADAVNYERVTDPYQTAVDKWRYDQIEKDVSNWRTEGGSPISSSVFIWRGMRRSAMPMFPFCR